jgi:hypothetical protein
MSRVKVEVAVLVCMNDGRGPLVGALEKRRLCREDIKLALAGINKDPEVNDMNRNSGAS